MTFTRAALVLSLAGLTLLPGSPAHAAATCHGHEATIEASTGAVTGTSGDDVIVVSGTVAEVDSGEGNDLICLVGTSHWMSISTGPGDDVVDASASGANSATGLGTGQNSFIGSEYWEVVSVGEEDSPGQGVVRTFGGKDQVQVEPGAVVDADLGTGQDYVDFTNSYAGPGSVFDLGPGRDAIGFNEWYDAPDSGNTALIANLKAGVMTWRDVTSTIRGVEDMRATAKIVKIRGNERPNDLFAWGCEVDFHGKGGNDRMSLKPGQPDEQGFGCSTYHKRAHGGPGNDYFRGGYEHDVMIGGPGIDKAFGGGGGHDVCKAEILVGDGCRGK